jgi:hypothetical protein
MEPSAMASAVVRSKVPTVDDRIADGTLDADLVRGVVAQMVIRALQNPGGLRSKSVGVGVSRVRSGDVGHRADGRGGQTCWRRPGKPKVGTAKPRALCP